MNHGMEMCVTQRVIKPAELLDTLKTKVGWSSVYGNITWSM